MPSNDKPQGRPLVSIVVGSTSDAEPIAACRRALDSFGIPHEAKVLSAHRVPRSLLTIIRDATFFEESPPPPIPTGHPALHGATRSS